MPLSPGLEHYSRHETILKAAVQLGSGTYVLRTREEAIRWRFEAYYFRKLYNKKIRASGFKGSMGPYDDLVIKVKDNVVHIEKRRFEGIFYDPEGNVVELTDPYRAEEKAAAAELEYEARRIAKEMGFPYDDEDKDALDIDLSNLGTKE